MNIAIDIGNTRTKMAAHKNAEEIFFSSDWQAAKQFLIEHKQSISAVMIANSGNETEVISFLTHEKIPYELLQAKTPLPFSIQYETPQTLGADRLALIAGASFLYPKQNDD